MQSSTGFWKGLYRSFATDPFYAEKAEKAEMLKEDQKRKYMSLDHRVKVMSEEVRRSRTWLRYSLAEKLSVPEGDWLLEQTRALRGLERERSDAEAEYQRSVPINRAIPIRVVLCIAALFSPANLARALLYPLLYAGTTLIAKTKQALASRRNLKAQQGLLRLLLGLLMVLTAPFWLASQLLDPFANSFIRTFQYALSPSFLGENRPIWKRSLALLGAVGVVALTAACFVFAPLASAIQPGVVMLSSFLGAHLSGVALASTLVVAKAAVVTTLLGVASSLCQAFSRVPRAWHKLRTFFKRDSVTQVERVQAQDCETGSVSDSVTVDPRAIVTSKVTRTLMLTDSDIEKDAGVSVACSLIRMNVQPSLKNWPSSVKTDSVYAQWNDQKLYYMQKSLNICHEFRLCQSSLVFNQEMKPGPTAQVLSQTEIARIQELGRFPRDPFGSPLPLPPRRVGPHPDPLSPPPVGPREAVLARLNRGAAEPKPRCMPTPLAGEALLFAQWKNPHVDSPPRGAFPMRVRANSR